MLEIRTGITIPVTRDGVEVGSIHFNPNDIAFSERIYAMIGELDTAEQEYSRRVAELEKDTSVDKYGMPANQRERFAIVRGICETMHTKIDETFGEGTSAMVFGGALDLDAIWQFFDGLMPSMDEAQQARIKEFTRRHGNRQQRRALGKG